MIKIHYSASITVEGARETERRSAVIFGDDDLAGVIAKAFDYGTYYYSRGYKDVQLEVTARCSMCSGDGTVPKKSRMMFATKSCPMCRGKIKPVQPFPSPIPLRPAPDAKIVGKAIFEKESES